MMFRIRRLGSVVIVLGAAAALVVFSNGRERMQTQQSSPVNVSSDLAVPVVSSDEKLTTSWYCPGVPANDGGITGTIVVSNPSGTDITGTVTLLSGLVSPLVSALSVPAFSSIEIDAIGGIKSKFVSAAVEINGGVGRVEQHIVHAAGDSVALCANAPAPNWYFADGFTGADSIEQIVLTNPFTDSTVIDISFVTLETKREPANLQGFVLPPRSVTVLAMDEQGARNEGVLAVSMRASSGRFVAGRSQHFLGHGRLGYTMSLGASSTSEQWWFPNGEKNADVTEQLVIFNPGDTDRTLSVVFISTGVAADSLEHATITAPAGRVVNFNTASSPSFPDGRYGIFVSVSDVRAPSVNSAGATSEISGIVVEQVINRRVAAAVGTSVVLGMPSGAISTTWVAPSGVTANANGSFVVLNTTADEATISVASVGPAGAVSLVGLEKVVVPGSGLVVIPVPSGLPAGELILHATVPVVVQRLLGRGHELVGSSAVMAIPVVAVS